jgi:hypothetical protein
LRVWSITGFAELEERVAALESQVALVAVQDRVNLLSPADGSNLSEVIRQSR